MSFRVSVCLLTFSLLAVLCGQENLLRNPSFEAEELSDTLIRQRVRVTPGGDIRVATAGEMSARRDTGRARAGAASLLIENRAELGTCEVNFNRLPFLGQVKHRFQGYYYIGERQAEGVRVAGRVTFLDDDNKVVKYLFPEFSAESGVWHELRQDFYPPQGTARVTVTLWFTGGMSLWLDDLFFGEIQDGTVPERLAAARLLRQSEELTVWSECSYLKVPRQGVPAELLPGAAVELSAAGGEREPFQLIVSPRRPLPQVSLRFSPLRRTDGQAEIPAGSLGYRAVGYVHLGQPDNPLMQGWQADPLLPDPEVAVAAGDNQPFLVRVDVPPEQPAGAYAGTLQILDGEQVLDEVALRLQVYAFSLPALSAFKSYFYTRPFAAYQQNDPRPTEIITEDMQAMLREHRISGNQALGLPRPRWEIRHAELQVVDWSEFDNRVRHWHATCGLRQFPAAGFWMMGDNSGWFSKNRRVDEVQFAGYPILSAEGLRYMGQYARQFTTHVAETFPELEFLAYIYDEPPPAVYADLKKLLDYLHAAAPDLRIFIPKSVTDEIGYVHTWCVPFSPGYLQPERQAQETALGKQVWYYNWPVRLDDFDYIRNRLFPWQIYAADGVGGLLWNTVSVPEGVNPWEALDKTYGCGSATIFYPPRHAGEGLIPSLRSAQIRESIDDFDYFVLLERRLDVDFPGLGRSRVKELLRGILPDLAFDFHNHPHLLYALRQRIAAEIELAMAGPPHLLLSLPPEYSRTELSEVQLQLHAPPGTVLETAGGSTHVVDASGRLDVPWQLRQIGRNEVKLRIRGGGKEAEVRRYYTLLPDPSLKLLQQLQQELQAEKLDAAVIAAFLKNVEAESGYDEATRARAAELLQQGRTALVEARLARPPAGANPLSEALRRQANWAFAEKLFSRSVYYLHLAEQAAAAGPAVSNGPVSIRPLDFHGHFALELKNERLQVILLETGGRIISFRIDGVECLAPGTFAQGLSARERAAQQVEAGAVTRLKGYGGFEDAGPGDLWPVSFVDWDLEFRQLSGERMAVAASMRLPGSPFRLCRVMSLGAGSTDLSLDYSIENLTPKEFASDDPAHFQLGWRARLVPAIGADGCRGDRLVVPAREPLAATLFDPEEPAFYERRQIRLQGDVMGAYDAGIGNGLALLLDPVMTHAYVWFQSAGPKPIYTLEIPRNFYGRSVDDPEANAPLTIKAGTSLHFRLVMRGLAGIADAAAWESATARP